MLENGTTVPLTLNGDTRTTKHSRLDILSHRHTAFLIQLRAIALLLSTSLAITVASQYFRVLWNLDRGWWTRELVVTAIDTIRWAIISFSVGCTSMNVLIVALRTILTFFHHCNYPRGIISF
jgi:hypothetical protein